jgi:DNA-directed RNA polymerase beta subunit
LNTAGDLMIRHFKEGMLKLRNSMRETMQTMEISSKAINPINIINAKAIWLLWGEMSMNLGVDLVIC